MRLKTVFARCAISGLSALILVCAAWSQPQSARREYPGFDRNDYPGDAALPALHKSFRYSVYWLNNPPGEQHNTWTGKREILKKNGFGFLILFNGRLDADLKGKNAAALGTADGKAAASAAAREGFAHDVLIFLDMEEGGRLLQEQADYLFAWADAVQAAGARAGVYCSAIEVTDSSGKISSAKDIVDRQEARAKNQSKGSDHAKLKLWVANDQCAPSPGCTLTHVPSVRTLSPDLAGSVLVWQYAQSPRRPQFTAGCPANYSPDNNCYAPGLPNASNSFVDLDTSESSDPSEAREK